jgi:hypothetical protein
MNIVGGSGGHSAGGGSVVVMNPQGQPSPVMFGWP